MVLIWAFFLFCFIANSLSGPEIIWISVQSYLMRAFAVLHFQQNKWVFLEEEG